MSKQSLLSKTANFIIKCLYYIKWVVRFLRQRHNPFYSKNLKNLREAILTNYPHFNSNDRWKIETDYQIEALRPWLHGASVICDFGIGIGRMSGAILEKFPNVKIVGVDSSKRMMEFCRKEIAVSFPERLRLIAFDNMSDIKNQSVDFILSIYVLQHLPAKVFDRALKEMHRIIKPDGMLYLLNSTKRYVIDGGPREQWYDDHFPQEKHVSKYFQEVKDVELPGELMKVVLETHISKLFRPR